jgi:hypothetical protein
VSLSATGKSLLIFGHFGHRAQLLATESAPLEKRRMYTQHRESAIIVLQQGTEGLNEFVKAAQFKHFLDGPLL